MKKVLILSYFFPPCNLTAAQRTLAWAKYLPEKGIYPIIIANNWDKGSLDEKIRIEKYTNYEVHYLSHKISLRDKLSLKNNVLAKLVSKGLTFFTLILQSFILFFNPFKHFYYYCDKLLEEDESISSLIVSANPFELFQVCYLLKKKYHTLNWIADYRDEWTTRELYKKNRGKLSIVRISERYAEKKYTSNAVLIITVCSYFLARISSLIETKGEIVENGYNLDSIKTLHSYKFEIPTKFLVVYSGTLYHNQPLKPFITIFDNFLAQRTKKEREKIELVFLGSKSSISKKQTQEIKNSRFTNNITIHERLELSEANKILNKASFIVMFPYLGMEGIPTSKLYDNLIFKKKIILSPTDNNIIEEVLIDSKLGLIDNGLNNLIEELNSSFEKFTKGENLKVNDAQIEKYSRKQSTFALAEIIHNYI